LTFASRQRGQEVVQRVPLVEADVRTLGELRVRERHDQCDPGKRRIRRPDRQQLALPRRDASMDEDIRAALSNHLEGR
jgi:hypothetical protein